MEEEKRQQRADREEEAASGPQKRERNFFMPDGRPFNMNEARIGFRLLDNRQDHWSLFGIIQYKVPLT